MNCPYSVKEIKNDDDDDDDELFLCYGWPTKGVYSYFQLGPLPEILIIAILENAGFKPVQNLSLALVEWSCTVVIPAAKIWKYLATWEPEAKNIFEIDIALINFLL